MIKLFQKFAVSKGGAFGRSPQRAKFHFLLFPLIAKQKGHHSVSFCLGADDGTRLAYGNPYCSQGACSHLLTKNSRSGYFFNVKSPLRLQVPSAKEKSRHTKVYLLFLVRMMGQGLPAAILTARKGLARTF
ncbi:MAG: hypothetical protein E7656_04345 [Ruminococcaceae bacterium]|nr:hypothetical protein [Oscillospiraceae bacterium]